MTALARWGIVAGGLAASVGLLASAGSPEPGDVVEARLSLVPGDAQELVCAWPHAAGPRRCALLEPEWPWQEPPDERSRIVPVVTLGRALVAVSGLFADPAVADRMGEQGGGSERFVARCRLRLLRRAMEFRARFSSDTAFGQPQRVWVADVLECTVHE